MFFPQTLFASDGSPVIAFSDQEGREETDKFGVVMFDGQTVFPQLFRPACIAAHILVAQQQGFIEFFVVVFNDPSVTPFDLIF